MLNKAAPRKVAPHFALRSWLLLMAMCMLVPSVRPTFSLAQESNTDAPVIDKTVPTTDPAIVEKIVDARKAEQSARDQQEQVVANLATAQEILSIGLDNDETGSLLRESRRQAPDLNVINQMVASREREMAQARLKRVRLLEKVRSTTNPVERGYLAGELVKQNAYLKALEKTMAAERDLATQSQEFQRLIDARLLWIPSAAPVSDEWLRDVVQGARWISDPNTWLDASRRLFRRYKQTFFVTNIVTLAATTLLILRRRLKQRLSALSSNVNSYTSDSYLLTIRAFLVTLLLSAPIPIIMGTVGTLLATQRLDAFGRSVGEGLLSAASVYLLLGFFHEMCRSHGLADAHFGWPKEARKTLFYNLYWLIIIEVPAAFVAGTCNASRNLIHTQGLGRFAFIIGSVGLALFVMRVFRPKNGVFADIVSKNGWAWRLRRFWYGALVLLPTSLILAAAAGYYYTAVEIQGRYFTTGVIVLAGMVCYSMATRWLLVARRRLAIQQARKRLAEQREARRKATSAEPQVAVAEEAAPELQIPMVDIASASKQTLTLLRGLVWMIVLGVLWAVWAEILPALTILERVELTHPTLDLQNNVVAKPITAWSLLLSLITLILTAFAARNLPAALELFVLQRFPLDRGIRYAASTLTRYIVVAVGVLTASRLLGIEWSRAQWIIAALGVGLGFGMQEIVANFVSGLIILFERPVRVGDTVTVAGVSGTVSQLQIRATRIIDSENKEVLVPNKSFITLPVVNWTLNNTITRLRLKVRLTADTHLELAHKTLATALLKVTTLMQEPAPTVYFVGFGDNTLDFELRGYVSDPAHRTPTINALQQAILASLAEAGITIPPQYRELNVTMENVDRLRVIQSSKT